MSSYAQEPRENEQERERDAKEEKEKEREEKSDDEKREGAKNATEYMHLENANSRRKKKRIATFFYVLVPTRGE